MVLVTSVQALVGYEMATALVNPNLLCSYIGSLEKGFEPFTGNLATEIYGRKKEITRNEFIAEMVLRPYALSATEYRQKVFSSYNSLPKSVTHALKPMVENTFTNKFGPRTSPEGKNPPSKPIPHGDEPPNEP